MHTQSAPRHLQVFLASTLVLVLTGCGGGGGGSNTPAPPTSGPLKVTGTVATGAPLANVTVDIRCRVGGTVTAQTNASGSYSHDFASAALPCLVSAPPGAQAMHAVANTATSGTATANVTPLSEWLVVRISGADVATYTSNIASDSQAAATTTALAAALPILRDALVDVTDLAGVDPVSDVWSATLAGKVAAVTQAMATASTTTTEVAASFATFAQPLPPAGDVKIQVSLALSPRAASCAGLRTGTYRLLDPNVATIAAATPLVTVNATALTGQWQDGRASPSFTLAGASCDYTMNPGSVRLIVGTKGTFAMAQSTVGANKFSAMLIREQPVPLSSLAGEWNMLNYVKPAGSATYATHSETFTLDANGNFFNVLDCATLTTCAGAGAGSLVANAAGGYTRAAGVSATTRIFAVKSADGQVALLQVGIEASGERRFGIATRKITEPLPVLGSTWLANEFLFTSAGVSQLPAAPRYDILATNSDPQNTFYLRRNLANPTDQQAFQMNTPRAGLRLRAPNPGTGLPSLLSLQLPALDGIVWGDPGNSPGFFGVSVLGP
jgi:hypothetical protein